MNKQKLIKAIKQETVFKGFTASIQADILSKDEVFLQSYLSFLKIVTTDGYTAEKHFLIQTNAIAEEAQVEMKKEGKKLVTWMEKQDEKSEQSQADNLIANL